MNVADSTENISDSFDLSHDIEEDCPPVNPNNDSIRELNSHAKMILGKIIDIPFEEVTYNNLQFAKSFNFRLEIKTFIDKNGEIFITRESESMTVKKPPIPAIRRLKQQDPVQKEVKEMIDPRKLERIKFPKDMGLIVI